MFFRDSEEFRSLITAFKKADERVLSTVLNTNADSVEEYRNKTFNYVNQVNVSLMKKTIAWAEKDIPVTYQQGRKRVSKDIALDTATMLGTFGLVTLADVVIKGSKRPKTTKKRINIPPPSDNLSEKEQKKVNLHTETAYIELSRRVQHATDLQKEKINQAINQIEKSGYGVTVERVKDLLKDTLEKENKSLFVTYSNGSKMPLEKYAEMCARTSRLETINTGVFNRVKELGYDLVLCSVVPNCCPYCKKYEGKVYSISGKDKRFPALYETALQKGYNVMHPNCRHEFTLFVESMVTATDLNKLIAKSNRFEEFNKNDKIFKIYNKNQALQRQWIEEFREYSRMKAYYKEINKEIPYKTLASFRRSYRADKNSMAYKKAHYWKLSENQIKNMPPPPFNADVIMSEDYVNKFAGLGNKLVVRVLAREAKQCIKRADKSTVEFGRLIDLNGNIVKRISGMNSSADYEDFKFEKYEKNSLILVHNHPHSSSFSFDDILTVSQYPQIKTIIAVGHDGTVYSLSIGDGKRVDRSNYMDYNKYVNLNNGNIDDALKYLSKEFKWRYEKK